MSERPERPAPRTSSARTPTEFRNVLGQFATGVTIITAIDDGEPVGVAANSFTSVSLDPPLVLFCVARTSTHLAAHRAGAQVRGQHPRRAPGGAVAGCSRTKGADRFGQADWHAGVGGSPVLHETLAYLDCEFWAEYDGGDHIIVVGRVLDLGVQHDAGPLVFFRGQYGRIAPTPTCDAAATVVGLAECPRNRDRCTGVGVRVRSRRGRASRPARRECRRVRRRAAPGRRDDRRYR